MPKGKRSRAFVLAQCIIAVLLLCQHIDAAKLRVGRPGRQKSRVHSQMPPQCGRGWQLWYSKLHAEILRRPSPEQRLAVVQVTYNGLGDRLASIVSVFWFAAVTGRAFRIQWWEYEETVHPQLEVAVSSPHIDWKSVPSDRELGNTHIEDHPKSPRAHHPFGHADLATIGNQSRTVWWKANTGSLDELFYNPHHRQQLFEWGLRPETAAGCALAYLFKPRPETLELVKENLVELSDKKALKIGVHIRYGDDYLRDGPKKKEGPCKGHINDKLDWWRCAKEIEEQYKMPEQRVIWYVMSDCEGIPFRAAEAFGDRVLLPSPAARVDHIDHATSNRTHDELVLRSTFAEHHIFSMTDFQVITDMSSYGKMAALASLRSRSIFVVKTLFKVEGKPHGCLRTNFDSFEYLANAWVKI